MHTKMALNVSKHVDSLTGIADLNGLSRNQGSSFGTGRGAGLTLGGTIHRFSLTA